MSKKTNILDDPMLTRRRSDRIRLAREAMNLSQSDVCKHLSISQSTVSRWEKRGESLNAFTELSKLAELYNVSYLWLAYSIGSAHLEHASDEREVLDAYSRSPQRVKRIVAEILLFYHEECAKQINFKNH